MNSWSTFVPVAPSASHGKMLPASTTKTSVQTSTTAGSRSSCSVARPAATKIAADHDRRDDEGAALAETHQGDHAGDQGGPAGGRDG